MTRSIHTELFRAGCVLLAIVVTSSRARADDPTPATPVDAIVIDPGADVSAVVSDPLIGEETPCEAPCTVRPEGPLLDVELRWANSSRHDRVRLDGGGGRRYRAGWNDRTGEQVAGWFLLFLGQGAAFGFAGGALVACRCIFGSGGDGGSTVLLLGLAITSWFGSVIGGSYLAGLRSHATLEVVPGVTATAYVDVSEDRAVVGIGGTF